MERHEDGRRYVSNSGGRILDQPRCVIGAIWRETSLFAAAEKLSALHQIAL